MRFEGQVKLAYYDGRECAGHSYRFLTCKRTTKGDTGHFLEVTDFRQVDQKEIQVFSKNSVRYGFLAFCASVVLIFAGKMHTFYISD